MRDAVEPDRIRNEYVRRSLGVMDIAGENEENRSRGLRKVDDDSQEDGWNKYRVQTVRKG